MKIQGNILETEREDTVIIEYKIGIDTFRIRSPKTASHLALELDVDDAVKKYYENGSYIMVLYEINRAFLRKIIDTFKGKDKVPPENIQDTGEEDEDVGEFAI